MTVKKIYWLVNNAALLKTGSEYGYETLFLRNEKISDIWNCWFLTLLTLRYQYFLDPATERAELWRETIRTRAAGKWCLGNIYDGLNGGGGGYFYPILIDDDTKIHRAFFSWIFWFLMVDFYWIDVSAMI